MIKATIEDRNGDRCSLTIFPDRWADLQKYLKKVHNKVVFDVGLGIHFSGTANIYEQEIGIIFEKMYNIAPPPSLPEDLKSKKVSLKDAKKEMDKPASSLLEEIENNLYDQGLIDLDSEQEDD